MGAGDAVIVGSSEVEVGDSGELVLPPAAITVAATMVDISFSEGVPVGVHEASTIIIPNNPSANNEIHFFMGLLSFCARPFY